MPSESSSSSTECGITYYSLFQNKHSVNNPIVDNEVYMKSAGNFRKEWTRYSCNFDTFGYGLKRTQQDRSAIYCTNASKLFSMKNGYIGITLNFPYDIVNGAFEPAINKDIFLFGVNVGLYDIRMPGLSAFFTNNGIVYTMWSSAAKFSLTDNITNINENEDMLLNFFGITQDIFKNTVMPI